MLEGEEPKRLSTFADPHRSFTQWSRGSCGSTGECSATRGEKATPHTWWGAASPQGRLLEPLCGATPPRAVAVDAVTSSPLEKS